MALFCAANLNAGTLQDHDSIRKAAEQHVLELLENGIGELSVEAGQIDRRLRLSSCEQPLDTFAPYRRGNSERITVGVRCDGIKRWTLYVPVSVTQIRPVVVTNRTLPRGTLISAADVRVEERNVAQLHRGYIADPKQAVGKRVKQSLAANRIVTPTRIEAQNAVKRGSQVTIIARIGTLEVRVKGEALDNGVIGERIRVRNTNSEREVEATVIAKNLVRVTT